ncbi:LPS assembly lipoprotein LptE [Nitrosomonas sp.]|uniref:LPS-assembly lipoprotein LptE n=2 Tax=Nitrosomonas sp. TaxID=42353 RepID=UPI0025EE7E64|nr:LPS assembly lipoprotein LptE [Nitrosomonas sp.]MDR4515361.1 LPS assembly lipoprotein LptE [Nitrosomonas sp.]
MTTIQPTIPFYTRCMTGLMILLILAACGFKLRGQISSLPFETLYIAAPPGHTIGSDLRRAVDATTTTKIVDSIDKAEAVLQVLNANNERRILSLSGGGRVREFELIFRITTRLIDNKGNEIVPENTITLLRILPFLDAQILAKEAEEQMLYQDMQADAVQQIIWRLSTVQKSNFKPETASIQ